MFQFTFYVNWQGICRPGTQGFKARIFGRVIRRRLKATTLETFSRRETLTTLENFVATKRDLAGTQSHALHADVRLAVGAHV